MSSRARTLLIFTAGVVLAFAWGLYYVILTVAGFDLDLTLAFLVPTIVVIAGLVGLDLYMNRRRKSRDGAGA